MTQVSSFWFLVSSGRFFPSTFSFRAQRAILVRFPNVFAMLVGREAACRVSEMGWQNGKLESRNLKLETAWRPFGFQLPTSHANG